MPFDRPIAEDVYPDLLEECLNKAAEPADFWMAVESAVCQGEPSRLHMELARLPFKVYATTNFDCLLSDALSANRAPRISSYPHLEAVDMHGGAVAHLHGMCLYQNQPGSRLQPEAVVLTRSQYATAYSHHTSLPQTVDAIFSKYRVFVVGASMADTPLASVLGEVRSRKESQARAGMETRPNKHYALVATNADEVTEAHDWTWRGAAYGVKPIFYCNSADGQHEPVPKILAWLGDQISALTTLVSEGEDSP